MDEFKNKVNKVNNALFLKQYIYRAGSYHFNWHHPMELLVILNGEVEVCTQGYCKILEKDDVILINSNSGHATMSHEPDSIVMLLHIDPAFFNEYYKSPELLSFDLSSTKETRYFTPFSLIRMFLSEMILCSNIKEPEKRLFYESRFYSLMHTIVQYFPPMEMQSATLLKNQNKKAAIEKLLKYIDKNFAKKITLDMLAKECGYNSNYVSQLFKTSMGINFYDYLTRIRLREATRDLSKTEYKVLDIALENGFSDIKSFNTAFRNYFGKSPTDYRKKLNNDIAKVDESFKKQFIPVNDELVTNKLGEYRSLKDLSFMNAAEKDKVNMKNASNIKSHINQLSHKFKELSKSMDDLLINIDELGK